MNAKEKLVERRNHLRNALRGIEKYHKGSWLYLIRFSEYTKIGISSRLSRRITEHCQQAISPAIECYAIQYTPEGAAWAESMICRRLYAYVLKGNEYFRLTPFLKDRAISTMIELSHANEAFAIIGDGKPMRVSQICDAEPFFWVDDLRREMGSWSRNLCPE